MKFCQPHWDKLRVAVMETRGLGHLVASNGRDAMARTIADLKGDADVSDYDPLTSCFWMIHSKAIEFWGFAMLAGEDCPICISMRDGVRPADMTATEAESWWIDGPADSVLKYCREKSIDKPFTPAIGSEP